MSTPITILHISDLHFESDKTFDREIVIKTLLEDVIEQRAQGINFDLIIFSGDLVQAGRENKNFDGAKQNFIEPLLKAANLAADRLIIVPGNHDVNTDEVVSFIDSGLSAELSTVEKINEFIDGALSKPSKATESALIRMSNYDNFYSSLSLASPISKNAFFRTKILPINGLTIGIAEFNSAWRSVGKSIDKNHLIIGERAVDIAINDLANTDIRVCVAHHPPEWLLEADANAVENRMFSAFDLICFGHTHKSLPAYRATPLGNSVISQSGTIYANRKYFNGYQIVQWDEANRTVSFFCRLYLDDSRRKFSPAENVAPGGRFQIKLPPRSDRKVLSELEIFLRSGRPCIRRAANEHISFTRSKGSQEFEEITEKFVCPPLSIHREAEQIIVGETSSQSEARETDVDSMLRQPDDILLLGDGETGRTSLVHFMAVRASEGVCDQPRIPAVLNVPLVVKSVGYDRALKAYYSDAEISPRDMNAAIKELPWIVFLDDFNAGNPEHVERLVAIRKEYPKHRLAIVMKGRVSKVLEGALGGKQLKIDINYLTRKNIRQLSRVRYTGNFDSGLEDPAYNLVMRHINDARLPRTGYMVTLLLWAAEQDKLGENLNEAILLENLISFLLGKANFDAALRNQFDPRAQEFLLRAIANELKSIGGWLESNKLLEFIIQYFESRGLRFGAKEVLAEFITCGLLCEQDGYIAFKYPCYQEYFVALDLLHDRSKLADLLSAPGTRILWYSREIDLWSSLARELHGTDKAILKLLSDAQLDVAKVTTDLGELQFDGREISFKPTRVKELLENPPTKDQIDEILDKAEGKRPVSTRRSPKSDKAIEVQDATEKEIPDFNIQRLALELLTRVARNSDHEKLESKRELSATLLKLWSGHTSDLLSAFRKMLKDNADEIENRSKLTSDDLQRLGNFLAFLITYGSADEISNLLTSDSLRIPLKEIVENNENPEGVRFLAALAFAETWDDAGIDLMDSFLRTLKNIVLKHAALTKMLTDYRMQRYRRSSADKFRNLIVEFEIAMGAASKERKGENMAELLKKEAAE